MIEREVIQKLRAMKSDITKRPKSGGRPVGKEYKNLGQYDHIRKSTTNTIRNLNVDRSMS
jgi:hypothetical protein